MKDSAKRKAFDEDGITQVMTYIVRRENLDALALMAEGGQGSVEIGCLKIRSTSKKEYTLNIDGLYMHVETMKLTYYEGKQPLWVLQLFSDLYPLGRIYFEEMEE